jgi:hypothetical protein
MDDLLHGSIAYHAFAHTDYKGGKKMKQEKEFTNAVIVSIIMLVLLSGCASFKPKPTFKCPMRIENMIEITPGTLGSWENPIKCDSVQGEHEYLGRLRGPDGLPVTYERLGNCGHGVNGNIVDVYAVVSQDDSIACLIYMDMYYKGHVETEAVEGFSILNKDAEIAYDRRIIQLTLACMRY